MALDQAMLERQKLYTQIGRITGDAPLLIKLNDAVREIIDAHDFVGRHEKAFFAAVKMKVEASIERLDKCEVSIAKSRAFLPPPSRGAVQVQVYRYAEGGLDGRFAPQVVPIEEYAHYVNVNDGVTFEEKVTDLATMAANNYIGAVVEVATKGGRNDKKKAVVSDLFKCEDGSKNLMFYVVKSGPSAVDPASFLRGWVSYKFKFAGYK